MMSRGAMVKVERITAQMVFKCTSEGNYSNLVEILKKIAEIFLFFFKLRKFNIELHRDAG